MRSTSKELIEKWTPETTEMVLHGDTDLNQNDIEEIASKVRESRNLDKFSLVNCSLESDELEGLVNALTQSQTLTKVSFAFNEFISPAFLEPLAQSKTVHTIDLSKNNYLFDNSKTTPDKFIEAVLKNDSIAVLKLPNDYFSGAVGSFKKQKNLLRLEFDAPASDTVKEEIDSACKRNREKASELIGKILKQQISTDEEAGHIRNRLPAILYLAEENGNKDDVVKGLRILEGFSFKTGINDFLPESQRTEANVDIYRGNLNVVPSAGVALTAPTLPQILASLSKLDAVTIEKGLEAIKDDEYALTMYGSEALDAFDALADVALDAALDALNDDFSVKAMAEFLDNFHLAQKYLDEYATHSAEEEATPKGLSEVQSLTDVKMLFSAKRKALMARLGRDAKELHNLDDAGHHAELAAKILKERSSEFEGMEKKLGKHLAIRADIHSTYKEAALKVVTFEKVGEKVLDQWREEEKGKVTILNAGDKREPAPEEYNIQTLEKRLEYLERLKIKMGITVINNQVSDAIYLDQIPGAAEMRMSVPELKFLTVQFINQIIQLKQAEMYRTVAKTTASLTESQLAENIEAAKKTEKAIESMLLSNQYQLELVREVVPEAMKHVSADTRKKVFGGNGDFDEGQTPLPEGRDTNQKPKRELVNNRLQM